MRYDSVAENTTPSRKSTGSPSQERSTAIEPDRRGEVVEVAEPHVTHRDERPDRLQLDPEPGGVPEGAVGVREPGEQVGVLAVRARGDDVAGAGEDVDLEHRLVRQPGAERRRLDAEAGDRAAERDRLAAAGRRTARSPCGRVAATRFSYVHMPCTSAVRSRSLIEITPSRPATSSPGASHGGPRPEQVRRPLREPHRPPGRDRARTTRTRRSTARSCTIRPRVVRRAGDTDDVETGWRGSTAGRCTSVMRPSLRRLLRRPPRASRDHATRERTSIR